jgi:protein-disulfide isomerase-like protein with CxxC motif
MGIQGFPTVVLRKGEELRLLVAGFVKFENLKPHLDRWIAGEEPFDGGDAEGLA